jgi:hypothetical protein
MLAGKRHRPVQIATSTMRGQVLGWSTTGWTSSSPLPTDLSCDRSQVPVAIDREVSSEFGGLGAHEAEYRAVVTGDMDMHFPDAADGTPGRLMPSVALQVWVKRDGRWQLVAIQTAPRGVDDPLVGRGGFD